MSYLIIAAISGAIGGLTGTGIPWLHWYLVEHPQRRREYRQQLIDQGVMNEAGQYFYSDGRLMP
jgi:hypothetical protein